MTLKKYCSILTLACLVVLVGCARNENSQDLKEKTAEATAGLKRNAKAMAEGVREGWNRDKPLNINTATRDQIVSLPGVTTLQADAIITGRPYDDPSQLVTRRILPQPLYDQIADKLTAKK
jgi:hypothetical protein